MQLVYKMVTNCEPLLVNLFLIHTEQNAYRFHCDVTSLLQDTELPNHII